MVEPQQAYAARQAYPERPQRDPVRVHARRLQATRRTPDTTGFKRPAMRMARLSLHSGILGQKRRQSWGGARPLEILEEWKRSPICAAGGARHNSRFWMIASCRKEPRDAPYRLQLTHSNCLRSIRSLQIEAYLHAGTRSLPSSAGTVGHTASNDQTKPRFIQPGFG